MWSVMCEEWCVKYDVVFLNIWWKIGIWDVVKMKVNWVDMWMWSVEDEWCEWWGVG